MAAEVMLSGQGVVNFLNLFRLCRTIRCQTIRSLSYSAQRLNESNENEKEFIYEEDEGDIEAKRDISRLPKRLKHQMEHHLQPPNPDNLILLHQRKVAYHRKLYAKYGKASGVDPSLCWPSKQELSEQIEFEKEWEPTLQERWAQIRAQQQKEELHKEKIDENIASQMAKMPKVIEQFRQKLRHKEETLETQKDKHKALLDEARDFFGYDVDKNDPRFVQMQELKAEEEAKMRKKMRKAQRDEKWQKTLALMAEEAKKAKEAQVARKKTASNVKDVGEQ